MRERTERKRKRERERKSKRERERAKERERADYGRDRCASLLLSVSAFMCHTSDTLDRHAMTCVSAKHVVAEMCLWFYESLQRWFYESLQRSAYQSHDSGAFIGTRFECVGTVVKTLF